MTNSIITPGEVIVLLALILFGLFQWATTPPENEREY